MAYQSDSINHLASSERRGGRAPSLLARVGLLLALLSTIFFQPTPTSSKALSEPGAPGVLPTE